MYMCICDVYILRERRGEREREYRTNNRKCQEITKRDRFKKIERTETWKDNKNKKNVPKGQRIINKTKNTKEDRNNKIGQKNEEKTKNKNKNIKKQKNKNWQKGTGNIKKDITENK